jgi:hypothetical protein
MVETGVESQISVLKYPLHYLEGYTVLSIFWRTGGLDKVTSLQNETISKFVMVSEISKTIW